MTNNNLPQYEVFIINENNDKKIYTKVGVAWNHKNGTGINIQIINGISITGNIVLFSYKTKEEEELQQ